MTSCSLHIGLNAVDPDHYAGWSGPLQACEADMRQMARVAKEAGFTQQTMLATRDATRARVLAAIRSAASQLQAGEMFLITYSGHGGKIPDLREPDDGGDDETWCLHDGQLIDDELLREWDGFRAGARILIVSDSCHSGGMDKFARTTALSGLARGDRARNVPSNVLRDTYNANKAFYEQLQNEVTRALGGRSELQVQHGLKASCALLAACHDYQLSYENEFGGYFTSALVDVWNYGRFQGNYGDFIEAIMALIPGNQAPQLKPFGDPANAFMRQRPFYI